MSIGSVARPLLSVVTVWLMPFKVILMIFPFNALPLASFKFTTRLAPELYSAVTLLVSMVDLEPTLTVNVL